jgi:AmmeMemoRadiSam system protein A
MNQATPGDIATHATSAEQDALLRLARAALEQHLGRQVEPVAIDDSGILLEEFGAFVTLRLDGNLRGCMGSLVARQRLRDEVQRVTLLAADRDPRFPPVSPEELDRLTIEVTILGPLEPVTDESEIEIGVHGLFLVHGRHRGTLLPQVASSRGWSRSEFLEHLCLKAGLPVTSWQGAELYRFTAQSFSE